MIKPYIELTKDEFDALLENKNLTWADLERDYPQPDWCSYPHATRGALGCWSLIDFNGYHEKISRNYCRKCDCYIKKQKSLSPLPPAPGEGK